MLFEKREHCVRNDYIFEQDYLLAIILIAVAGLQIAWRLTDAKIPKFSTAQKSKEGFC